MAIYLAELIDEMRDLLGDATDTLVPFSSKVRYLNLGLAAMYPKIWQITRDTSITISSLTTREYTIPAAIASGQLLTVELETGSATGVYPRVSKYDIISPWTTPIITIAEDLTDRVGARLRLTAATQITKFVAADYAAAGSVLFTGPPMAQGLPVLYAMSMSMTRILNARMSYDKLSVQIQNNAVGPNDIMASSNFWMGQFLSQLDQLEMPFPSTVA